MEKKSLLLQIIFSIFLTTQLYGYDILHFYRATPLLPHPLFDRDHLWSVDVYLHTGMHKKGNNSKRKTVPLLDIFNPVIAKNLATGVPFLDPNNPLDHILLELEKLPDNGTFSFLSFGGKLITSEANFFITKHFDRGLFLQFHLPVRSCEITALKMTDLSPTSPQSTPNRDTFEWQLFLKNFDAILKRHAISIKPFDKTVVGSPTILFGYTHTFLEYQFIDFIDISCATGVTINVSSTNNVKQVFQEPFFSRSHTGIPLQGRAAIGFYDWLTIGAYAELTFFFAKTDQRRISTAPNQNGFIHLAASEVRVEKGPNAHLGFYIEGDHFVRGFSWTVGYSFAFSGKEREDAKNRDLFPHDAINRNKILKSWNMHTMHYSIEYDFSSQNSSYGPRISLGYNQVVGGKRIIKTGLYSGCLGIDWLF